MKKKTQKHVAVWLLMFLLTGFLITGCSIGTNETTRLRDLEFTVISEELLPAELKKLIDERKSAPFKITFQDNNDLYICIGYGEQPTGGYSIAVNDLYLTDSSIYISTSLLEPGSEEITGTAVSYPYIVVKTEYLDKTVVVE